MAKIILDACNNHLGYDDIIVAMIREAKGLGADYIKFQLFDPECLNTIYPNYSEYKEQLKKCQITEDKLELILNETFKSKVSPMFTIFSHNRIPFLKEAIGRRHDYAIKIASCDMGNISLIQSVKDAFDVPLFISCGMHSDTEIQKVRDYFRKQVNWLYCVSMYPTPPELIDYEKMKLFDGFSDHTKTIEASLKALATGTNFLEIHFTLGRSLPCKDSIVSKIPSEIEQIVTMRNYIDSIEKYKHRFIERVDNYEN